MKWWTTVGFVAVILFGMPEKAMPQRLGTALDVTLQAEGIERGDEVYVTDTAGRRIRDRIADVTAAGLAVTAGGEVWKWAGDDVRKVERWDRLRNGILIGAAVGAAYVGVGCVATPEECAFAVYYLALPAVAGGGFIGAIVDASKHETVYLAPGGAGLTLSPIVSRGRVGVAAAVGW